jgi:hypothetical protein
VDDPSLGDLDADGTQEIVFWVGLPERTRGVSVVKGDGSLLPGWPQVTNAIGNSGPALGDVDGDDHLEVVASTVGGAGTGEAGGGVYVWRSDGTPLPGWPKFIDFTGFARPPVIGDVDGDGIGDVIAVGGTAFLPQDTLVYAWTGSGDLISGFPIVIPFRSPSGPATIADIDRDGITDLGVTSEPGVFASKPATIHWFDLGVPFRPEGMEWPTWAHDMARTGSYSPPVQRVDMRVHLVPPVIHANTPAPPLTAIFRLPIDEAAMPTTFSLVKVDDEPVEPVEGQQLGGGLSGAGIFRRLVFHFDGEKVRSHLGNVGEHELTFRSETIGGLGGVQYEATASLTLRDAGYRFGWYREVENGAAGRREVPLTSSTDSGGPQSEP